LIFLSFGFSYFFLPIAGSYFVQRFFDEKIFIGFVILLIAPTTAVSAVWTRFSEGDEQLATTISVGSVVLSPVILPILLTYLLGSQTSVPVVSILIELLTVIVGGGILTIIVPSSIVSRKKITHGSRIALFAIIYSTTAQVGFTGFALVDLLKISSGGITLFICGLIVFIIIGKYVKIKQKQLTALFFSSNMKNLGIALLISNSMYPEPIVITTIVTYFLIQQVGSAIIADFVS
jgi:predicted Na+-dependent transporter